MIRNSGNFNGKGLKALEARIKALGKKKVVVGVPVSKNSDQDGTSMVTIAAAHEFGATIQHPGGTNYGYRTENDAIAGKSRFLRSGEGYMQTGRTSPYTIKIPERSFLRSTLNENKEEYARELAKGIMAELQNDGNPIEVFAEVGEKLMGDVRAKIQSGITPPLSKSTIKRKKSSKPLIDTGHLLQSITYEVREDE